MHSLLATPTTILLTGATSGIGFAAVRILLDEGHRLIVLARRASGLKDQLGADADLICYDCDLGNRLTLGPVLEKIAANHPDISIIVNNAGFQYPVPFTDKQCDFAQVEQEVAINLLAPTLIVYYLLAGLLDQSRHGAIVNVTSGLAFFPKQRTALYCATKAAVHSLSQSLRYQLENSHIDVIEAIMPLVDTPMTEGRGQGKISASAAANAMLAGIRKGQAEIYIGKARLVPILTRLAPSLGRRALRGS